MKTAGALKYRPFRGLPEWPLLWIPFFYGPDFLRYPFPSFFFYPVSTFTLPVGRIRKFAFHFQIAAEPFRADFTGGEALPNLTARFIGVAAVAEPAFRGQCFDFRENRIQSSGIIP